MTTMPAGVLVDIDVASMSLLFGFLMTSTNDSLGVVSMVTGHLATVATAIPKILYEAGELSTGDWLKVSGSITAVLGVFLGCVLGTLSIVLMPGSTHKLVPVQVLFVALSCVHAHLLRVSGLDKSLSERRLGQNLVHADSSTADEHEEKEDDDDDDSDNE